MLSAPFWCGDYMGAEDALLWPSSASTAEAALRMRQWGTAEAVPSCKADVQ